MTTTAGDDRRASVVRQEIAAAGDGPDADDLAEWCTRDVTVHDPLAARPRSGVAAYADYLASQGAGDRDLAVGSVRTADDLAVATVSTADGDATRTGLQVYRFADGAVVERWGALVPADALGSFAADFRGAVLTPGDDGYDDARSVWNGMIDRYPAVVARCAGVADVIAAVRFAREHDLLVAVRGGGHNVAGSAVANASLVVDCSEMRAVHVDPDARTATVEPGATWADVDRETQAFGLAVPGGLVSSTGVAGLTLGGGFGWLSRKYGATCDSLRSAELVTAEGERVVASADENPELFWGLRGGGGNFGVVTSFEFDLHDLGTEVLAGPIFHRLDDAADVVREYREVVADAPDELTCYLLFRRAPPAPFLPEAVHGEPVVAPVVCYAGDPETGERVADDLRAIGDPIADAVQPRRYVDFQQFSDASWEPGFRDYWKAEYLAGLPDGAIDVLVDFAATLPNALSDFKIAHFEGAIADVPVGATAYPHRAVPFVININTRWEAPAADEEHVAWTREFFEAVRPYSAGATYVNFLGEEGEDRVRAAYGTATYERLAALKDDYDPDNVFRHNQNVVPGE